VLLCLLLNWIAFTDARRSAARKRPFWRIDGSATATAPFSAPVEAILNGRPAKPGRSSGRRLEGQLIKPALPLPIGIGAPSLDAYACVAKKIKNPLLALL